MLQRGLVSFFERRPTPFKALTWYESFVVNFKYMRLQYDENNGIDGNK